MAKKKILFLTHSMTPYIEGSALSEFSREIPTHLQKNGYEVRVFMPRFGSIKERRHRLHEVIRLSGINIPIGEEDNPLIIKVASLPSAGIQVYFLDNEDFFYNREIFHEDDGEPFDDNDDRTIFFNKGSIEIIHKLGWVPDVIHVLGWMGSLLPLYARAAIRNEPIFRNTKLITSIFDADLEGPLGKSFAQKAIFGGQAASELKVLQNPTANDLTKLAIKYSDVVTVNQPLEDTSLLTFAQENAKQFLDWQHVDKDKIAQCYLEYYHTLLEDSVLQP